jgi:hypothetical protein
MSQQRRASGQEPAEAREEAQEERERERARAEQGNFGDRAAEARLADDPRIKAPRDRAGMPSIGDEQL